MSSVNCKIAFTVSIFTPQILKIKPIPVKYLARGLAPVSHRARLEHWTLPWLHLVAELCFLPCSDILRGQESVFWALVTSPCLFSVSALGFRCALCRSCPGRSTVCFLSWSDCCPRSGGLAGSYECRSCNWYYGLISVGGFYEWAMFKRHIFSFIVRDVTKSLPRWIQLECVSALSDCFRNCASKQP